MTSEGFLAGNQAFSLANSFNVYIFTRKGIAVLSGQDNGIHMKKVSRTVVVMVVVIVVAVVVLLSSSER